MMAYDAQVHDATRFRVGAAGEWRPFDGVPFDASDPLVAARGVLGRVYGYDDFRPGQERLIESILTGRDALGVMPTGAGKSLCYQVPGIMLPGLAMIVSPLVSLMSDQVNALIDAGVRGSYLNSTLTPGQQRTVMRRALAGTYKIMYVAPERLADPAFLDFARSIEIPLLAVDEAHCISQWGQDFRPSYLGIRAFVDSLPKRPVIAAFTATATEKVRRDIVRALGLKDPCTVVTGYDRPNLSFGVEHLAPKRKRARIVAYAAAHKESSGIVYCSTRKDVEQLAGELADAGFRAVAYHAGMPAERRAANQRAFISDDASIMVATNAFGMGIDKSNVRYVIHYNMPKSLEAYYQEAGRAGRDGEPADCLLFWSDGDVSTCRYFIEEGATNDELTPEEADRVRAGQRRLLEAMIGYCRTTGCLRRYILNYFGDRDGASRLGGFAKEGSRKAGGKRDADLRGVTTKDDARPSATGSASELRAASAGGASFNRAGVGGSTATGRGTGLFCGACSNCTGSFESIDVTEVARACVCCVREVAGSFGKSMIADIVRGSRTQRIFENGLNNISVYGTVKESASLVKEVIELLAAEDILAVTDGSYPVVTLGSRASAVTDEDFSFSMKRMKGKPAADRRTRTPFGGAIRRGIVADAANALDNEGLFERLRVLRKRLADEGGVPPYVVFSDRSLREMCEQRPSTPEELLLVNGVGERKLASYGHAFLDEIAAFEAE